MGWRRTVATIRMRLQVFFQVFAMIAEVHGFSRFSQHSHSSRRGSGDGRHSVEPARAALRRAIAAGVLVHRHAGRRLRPGAAAVRRRPRHLSGRLGGAGADPVRWGFKNAVSKHSRGAGAFDGIGDDRRVADGADHRAGRQICARPELDRSAADAAAVFLLVHAQGLRLRPRVGATLEVESGTNDPFAVFLTLMLVELISIGESSLLHVALEFGREAVLGAIVGTTGGRLVVLSLNRVALPQGLHAPFVATAALVIFGAAQIAHASGFLAVYLAGIIIGNRPTRAHNSVVTFLDAATWLAQIVMFVLLGLLVSPQRLVSSVVPAVLVALVLMLLARPLAVFLCLAPFRFNWREKLFIAWTGLRGAVAIFLASIPMLVGLSKAYLYFDGAFVVG